MNHFRGLPTIHVHDTRYKSLAIDDINYKGINGYERLP